MLRVSHLEISDFQSAIFDFAATSAVTAIAFANMKTAGALLLFSRRDELTNCGEELRDGMIV
jgi:hypothetical protein